MDFEKNASFQLKKNTRVAHPVVNHLNACGLLPACIKTGLMWVFLVGWRTQRQNWDVVIGREKKSYTLVEHRDLEKEPTLGFSCAIQVE